LYYQRCSDKQCFYHSTVLIRTDLYVIVYYIEVTADCTLKYFKLITENQAKLMKLTV